MKKSYTVKARTHYGTKGLDITIPADIVKEEEVNSGDIFKIDVEKSDEDLILRFTRVFKNS